MEIIAFLHHINNYFMTVTVQDFVHTYIVTCGNIELDKSKVTYLTTRMYNNLN